MTANLLYALGTLVSWAGWGFAIYALVQAARMVVGSPGVDRGRLGRNLGVGAVGAGVAFLIMAFVPMKADTPELAHFWRLPLVWFVMPWTAWLGFVSLVAGALRAIQGGLALNDVERADRFKAAGIWAVAAVVFFVLYRRDPDSTIGVLKGGMEFNNLTAFALLWLAVAAVVAMVMAGRSLATRGLARATIIQATLVVGSIIFGLPFVFAVVTSFKEDQDMSSPHGIVWVPRVQDTVPYFDPQDPLYEGTYQGDTVQGHAIAKLSNGSVRIDIQKPLSIRGTSFEAAPGSLKVVPIQIPLVTGNVGGKPFEGKVVKEEDDGRRKVEFTAPPEMAGKTQTFAPTEVTPVRHIGLRWQNYTEAISFLPPETHNGLVYLRNTLIIVIMSVLGTVLSCSIVAYAFSRMAFPGKNTLFAVLLSTMMLPGAVTLMPQFLIFRQLGWIDTLYPLWVPAFFGSAFNVFMLRQFFMQIPMELEDAAKIDGCGYLKTFWTIMLPLIKPALAVIAIWTFMGAWNNFMGPLIYVNSPENMPLSYALQLFKGDRSGEPGLLMAFATLTMLPVLALFFFAQRYFIEGVTLSGLGGR